MFFIYIFRYKPIGQSTETDDEFVKLFNLDLETNENLLSPIANAYVRDYGPNYDSQTKIMIRNGIPYANKSISTGDDFPIWWLQLSTNIILSSYITKHGEEKIQSLPRISPRQYDQSMQTNIEQNLEIETEKQGLILSARLSNVRKPSSSSITTSNHYEIIDEIDDGNNSRRFSSFVDHRQRVNRINIVLCLLFFK